MMMIVVTRKSAMGKYIASLPLQFFGWTATG